MDYELRARLKLNDLKYLIDSLLEKDDIISSGGGVIELALQFEQTRRDGIPREEIIPNKAGLPI